MLNDGNYVPKPSHIQYNVGDVYKHKVHGYRGVICGWWSECPADDEWVKRWGPFEKGTEQAFYRTLVHCEDR